MRSPMELVAQQHVSARPGLVIAGLFAASMILWGRVFARRARGQRVLEHEPRHSFPWHGGDVAIIMLWWFVGPASVAMAGIWFFGLPGKKAVAEPGAASDTVHPVARLLQSQHPGWVVLAVLTAVVLAPVVEEYVFRLILQGWIERRWRRLRWALPAALRAAPGTLSILCASCLFAGVHARTAALPDAPTTIALLLAVQTATSVITLLLIAALAWLRGPLRLEMLGIGPGSLHRDIKLGLGAWLLATPPVYFLFWASALVVPAHFAPDPIPLFLLALVLGLLYFRTHRIVAPIVTHAAFNATTVFIVFLVPQ